MKFKKVLNPVIWLINLFIYFSHLEEHKGRSGELEPYDFSRDLSYF